MARRKRAPGEGSVYQRKSDGLWVGAVTVGYDVRGNQRRIVVYGKTRQEAARKLAEKVAALNRGMLPAPEAITVRDWAQDWLRRKGEEVKAKTLEHYRYELSRALPSLKDPGAYDRLGRMRLQAVQPLHVRQHLDALRQVLTPYALKTARWLLHTLFEEAVRLELIPRNPVAPVRLQLRRREQEEKAARILQPDEARALLEALDAHPSPLALSLRLMLACGLRRGEALALTWGDIDFEHGLLHVRRNWTKVGTKGEWSEPKTVSSRRSVPIPHATLERLRAYREALVEKGIPEESLRDMFLFPSRRSPSRPVEPDAPNHLLRRICRAKGLPEVRVHDLRHTYGSFLLSQGAPVELVAERMGHANPNITLGIYRHLLEEERRGWVVDPEEIAGARAGG
ncbi:tyrosine-type recombinase/integrase [Thermus sp. SYSU G05001]|uniref:Tyrosine-type recombinase/integrase n=1 Tax=Thermus brevis TaxID=2862456 RepID=A0ABS7A1H9_9DEIN|nr:site-specific integrase [Thermus brevis]MBW6396157.1 tyrosine-type recombinase/integrase [Thermus brevis]